MISLGLGLGLSSIRRVSAAGVPAAPPVNVVAPVASGSSALGSTLSVTTGTWTGSPAPTFTYQWRRGATDIAGATGATYITAFPADSGASISCRVTATNASGTASAVSNAIAMETWTAPVNTVAPTVVRPAGSLTLSAVAGTWTGTPAPTFMYQWRRNGVDIAGATGATHTVAIPADSGASISCRVTATNAVGSASATSAANILPTWPALVNTVLPIVTHTAGTSNLAVSTGTWTVLPIELSGPALSFTNAAYICGANVGLINGQTYAFTVNFTKTGGSPVATIRVSTSAVAGSEGEPKIAFGGDRGNGARTFSGTITANGPAFVIGAHDALMTGTIESVTLTATPTFAYQWRRNGADVSGATAAAYVIPDNDVGTLWACTVAAGTGHAVGSATAVSVFVGPLDRLSVAPAAYAGLRRSRSAYTGPALRLRRASDGVESDVGFDTLGDLDQPAALAHVYSGTTAFLGGPTGYGQNGVTLTTDNPAAGQFRVIEDTTNGLHRVNKTVTGNLAAGTVYRAVTVVQRTGAARDVALELGHPGLALLVAFRLGTLTTETIVAIGATGVTASVRPGGTGRFICEVVFTLSNTATAPTFLLSLLSVGTGDTRVYAGDGASGVFASAPMIATAADVGGTISRLYGQMAGTNVEQTTAANQPVLIEAGAVAAEGARPTLRFNAGQDLVAGVAVAATAVSAVLTFDGAYTGPNAAVSAGSADQVALYRLGETAIRVGLASTTGGMADYNGVVPAGTPRIYYGAGPAFGVSAWENNLPMTKNTDTALGSYSTVFCLGSRRIGGASPLYLNGKMREAILFSADIPADDRTRLVRNQGAYYGIAVT